MNYSCIIVDMQPMFPASDSPSVQKACIREINKAMRDSAPIVFVEFDSHGHTLENLTDVVHKAKYTKVWFVIKDQDDGSKEITELLRKNHCPTNQLRVMGINSDYCVRATVEGFHRELPNARIQVIGDACNSPYNHKMGLKTMSQLSQVKMLRASKILRG